MSLNIRAAGRYHTSLFKRAVSAATVLASAFFNEAAVKAEPPPKEFPPPVPIHTPFENYFLSPLESATRAVIEYEIKRNPVSALRKYPPEYSFRYYNLYKSHRKERFILDRATELDPYGAKNFFETNRDPDLKVYSDLKKRADEMVAISNNLRQKTGKDGVIARQRFLDQAFRIVNGEFPAALSEFNRANWQRLMFREKVIEGEPKELLAVFNQDKDDLRFEPVLLVPVGVKKLPYKFAFAALSKNKPPVYIGIGYSELKRLSTRDEIVKCLWDKVDEKRKSPDLQIESSYTYEIPRGGQTACMFVCVPHYLRGMEIDVLDLVEIYNRQYQASIYSVCMEKHGEWKKALSARPELLVNTPPREIFELFSPQSASENDILQNLEASLKRAIDEGKSTFVLHYLMHGTEQGNVSVSKQALLPQILSPRKFIDLITADYNGSPISGQLDINIVGVSCYSGKQLDRMLEYLKEKDVHVKNLRIITDSEYTPSFAGTTSHNASVPRNDGRMSLSATSIYNRTRFNELKEALKTSGIEVPREFNTLPYEMQFVRAFSKEDSPFGQVLQAVHYHNDPDKGVVHKLARF